ncbi:hypothetical protein [Coleofasciculus sp. FACHB-129]|uniref:hypothetical protein n=1 Tax=Cyanophyceae TaxID=3028117 RepID=UPI0016823EBC|nr:hypothetical protein [Coleofasciculus sp. FACHB-129]MBD1893264.1 hypothetical protein [Coleofasciculus sp. FACHB-129]
MDVSDLRELFIAISREWGSAALTQGYNATRRSGTLIHLKIDVYTDTTWSDERSVARGRSLVR